MDINSNEVCLGIGYGIPEHWLSVRDILHKRSCLSIPFDGNCENYVKRIRYFVCNYNIGMVISEHSRQCPDDITVCATHGETGEQRFFCGEHGIKVFMGALDYRSFYRSYSFRFTASP